MLGDKLIDKLVEYVNPTRLPYAPIQCIDTVICDLLRDSGRDMTLIRPTIKYLQDATTRRRFEEAVICLDPVSMIFNSYKVVPGKYKYPVFDLLLENGHSWHINLCPGEPLKAEYVTVLHAEVPLYYDAESPPHYDDDAQEWEPVLL